jgi:hypothetical protein
MLSSSAVLGGLRLPARPAARGRAAVRPVASVKPVASAKAPVLLKQEAAQLSMASAMLTLAAAPAAEVRSACSTTAQRSAEHGVI